MNKLQIASLAGALSLGLLANPVPAPVAAVPAAVPSPVANVPAPVAVPAPVTVSVSASAVPSAVANAPAVEEAEPGALCKVYYVKDVNNWVPSAQIRKALEALEKGATAVDWGYDAKSSRFDAAAIAKHRFTVASWEGVLDAKRAGTIVVNATSKQIGYCVTINGQSILGGEQSTMSVSLKKGYNRISIVCARSEHVRGAFSIDFRDAASTEPARPLLPSMLKHLVGDEEGGVKNDIL